MKPYAAWGLVIALFAAMVAALVAPLPVAAALAFVGVAAMRQRWIFVISSVIMTAIYAAILGTVAPGPDPLFTGWISWGTEGAIAAASGMLRLAAIIAINLGAIARTSLGAWLDGLRLPPRWTAYTASVLLATQDLATDHQRIVRAKAMAAGAPLTRWQQARSASTTLVPMIGASVRRAETRREALRLAGLDTGPAFAPIVAMTALAIAGRLAFVALPNVSLAFVIVFAAGIVFGARVGMWTGTWSMLLTDLMLSGLAPTALVNVPAMALVGAIGGMLRPAVDRDAAVGALAATAGIVCTLLFSVTADTLEVVMISELRNTPGAWAVRVTAGLVFNAVPAIVNGLLFAAVVGPVARAFAAYRTAASDTSTSVVTHQSD